MPVLIKLDERRRQNLKLSLAVAWLTAAGWWAPGAAAEASPNPAWSLPIIIDRGNDSAAWSLRHAMPEIPRAELKVVEVDGQPALRFEYELGTKNDTYIYRTGLVATENDNLSLTFKAENIAQIYVRLMDSTGQDHQGVIQIQPGGAWQTVTLPVATGFAKGHWNGANDGKFHFPCGRLALAFGKASPQGRFWLRRVGLQGNTANPGMTWRLSFRHPLPAGVAFPGEKAEYAVKVENLVDAPRQGALRLRLRDADGQATEKFWPFQLAPLGEFVSPPVDLTSVEPAFRQLRAWVEEDGAQLGLVQSAVAVVRKLPNYGQDDPASFFGFMHVYQNPEAAERLGCKNYREFVWFDRNFATHDENWWTRLDQRVNDARAHGIQVVLCLEPSVKSGVWQNATRFNEPAELILPENLDSWRRLAKEVAERYRGRLAAIELVNEPNNEVWHTPDYPLEKAREIYCTLVKTAAEAVRAVDPGVQIIVLDVSGRDFHAINGVPTPQCPGEFLFTKAMLPVLKGDFDIYGGHPYCHVRILGRTRRSQMPEEMHFRELLIQAGDILEQNGCPRRLWPTEIGWSVIDPVDPPDELSLRFAAIVAQGLTLAKSVPGLEKAFWFITHWHNTDGDDYSLFHCNTPQKIYKQNCEDLFPTPAACAYGTTAYQLFHSRFVEEVKVGDNFSAWRFERTEDGRAVIVLWARSDGEFRLQLKAEDVTIFDLYNRQLAAGPQVVAPFSRAPLFLTAPAAAGEALAAAVRQAKIVALEPVRISKVWFRSRTEARAVLEDTLPEPVTAKLAFAGQTGEQVLRPGQQIVTWPQAEPIAAGTTPELSVTVAEAVKRASPRTDFWSAAKLAEVTIDGQLSETAALAPIVLDNRNYLMPPDAAWSGPADLSATAWLGWTPAGLYFAARVTDDRHQGSPDDREHYWQADSIQLALDPEGNSLYEYDTDDREVGLVLGPNGPHAYIYIRGKKLGPLTGSFQAKREPGATVYETLLPWAELGLTPPAAGRIMSVSFIVNENDGQGREFWLGWTPGVGESKAPINYRPVALEP